MFFLKEDTAAEIKLGPFVDKTDGVTYEVGMAAAMDHADTGVRLSKNGGTFADRHEGTEPVYDAFGYYLVKLDATDTNTPGTLKVIFGAAATCLPCEANFQIVSANVYDSLFAAATTDYLDVQVKAIDANAITADAINGDAITAAKIADNAFANEHFADGALTSTEITSAGGCVVASIANNAITANAINADAITNAKIADNAIAVENIADGAITAAKIADAAIDNATFAADVGSTAYATNIIALAAKKAIDNYDPPTNAEFELRSLPAADYTVVGDLGTVQTGDSYAIVNGDHGLVSIQDDIDEVLTRVPDATAGANGGLLIAGSNAATTFAALTVTAATTLTGNVALADGITVAAPSTADRPGVSITGKGTGQGIIVTGGGTSASGLAVIGGASNGIAIYARGDGAGNGLRIDGGDGDGTGVLINGGSSNGNAVTIIGDGTGHGIAVSSGDGATGNGINVVAASTNGTGVNVTGAGSGDGLHVAGGATGDGFAAVGGGTSGDGIYAKAAGTGDGLACHGGGVAGDGFSAIADQEGDGMSLTGALAGCGLTTTGGATGPGLLATGGGNHADADGIRAVAGGALAADVDADLTLSDAGVDAVFDRASSLTVSFETLLTRTYQILNNKMNVTDLTGVVKLRNLADDTDMAAGSVTDDLTTTVRAVLTWA